ncbi:MAG TPA: hypothetical protein VLC50_06010 [Actinomycetes bacterium]|nr:hypothetical protein [Actinomycetes bacterium]
MSAMVTLGLAPTGAAVAVPTAVLADVDPAKVQTGAIGMVVFLLLCGATALLLRSFRNQMRKVEQADLPHEKPRPHGPRPGIRLPSAEPEPGSSPEPQPGSQPGPNGEHPRG